MADELKTSGECVDVVVERCWTSTPLSELALSVAERCGMLPSDPRLVGCIMRHMIGEGLSR